VTPLLKRLEDAYPNDVRLAYRHFPLTEIHDKAQMSAEASEAAGAQGKFWEMHDLLFATFEEWSEISPDQFRAKLNDYARQIGLDVEQFATDLDGGKFTAKVNTAREFALQIGLGGTPFLLLNESPWPDSLSYLSYNNLDGIARYFIDLPKKQIAEYPAMAIDSNKTYVATIATDKGDITIELFAKQAPLAVNSFVVLAQRGWYDGVAWHRVVDQFVAQAGDPTGLGIGGVGYVYKTETSPDLKYAGAGWVGVARTNEIDTNGAQFFITRTGIGQEQLDALNGGPYTIFGRVTAGQNVVDTLTVRDPQSSPDTSPSVIQSITVEEK
jgi:cyclophilin family peptidyl-prolyl cis-trans isomerase